MPSDCIVPVVEITNIREHPGASLLSIAEVLGYQVVNGLVEDPEGPLVRTFLNGERDERGRRIPCPADGEQADPERVEIVRYNFRYKEGDRGIYFPADTVLTDKWAATFEVDHLLKSGNRVGRTRLRGEPSFGLVVGIPEGQDWELGYNAAKYFDAIKYTPPARSDPGAFAPYDTNIDPHFVKYTDIQNGLLLYDKFQKGEEVIASEKLHGANSRTALINGTIVAGSRTNRRVRPEENSDLKDNLFWSPLSNPGVENLLNAVAKGGAQTVILFGEIYGAGVQSLHYGQKKEKGYRAFDLYVDGDYWGYDLFKEVCNTYGVETAPVLYRGPFDLEKVKEISDGRSTLPGADNIREGVVVRSARERRDPSLGRMVLKFIGTTYDLSKHKKKDTTDV